MRIFTIIYGVSNCFLILLRSYKLATYDVANSRSMFLISTFCFVDAIHRNEQTGFLHARDFRKEGDIHPSFLKGELFNYPSYRRVQWHIRAAGWNSNSLGFSTVLRSRVPIHVVSLSPFLSCHSSFATLRSPEWTGKFEIKRGRNRVVDPWWNLFTAPEPEVSDLARRSH